MAGRFDKEQDNYTKLPKYLRDRTPTSCCGGPGLKLNA
jgi:hypothetical protein